MPLHLLGKKSWNVYNTDNVERVRRDEAEASARREAAEQRMQGEDAQRRIALLRGEKVEPVPELTETRIGEDEADDWRRQSRRDDDYTRRDRKRRRLRGEDDTDRDIRHARQGAEAETKATHSLWKGHDKEAPLQDHAGHIQLFAAPDEKAIRVVQKNAELEAEKAKRRQREEDKVTMHFSNAAGCTDGMQQPWYTATVSPGMTPANSASDNLMLAEVQGKDVWGNEDPRRGEREFGRISSNDPFAAMQNAQRQLKQSERDKEAWQRQHKAELEALKKEQARAKERKRRNEARDSLDGFSLDAIAVEKNRHRRHHHRRSEGRQHGHRSRNQSWERDTTSRHSHRKRKYD